MDVSDDVNERPSLAEARAALDYLLFEDEQSRVLSAHGASILDTIRRYIEAQEQEAS